MTTTHNLNDKELLVVDIPEGAKGFFIHGNYLWTDESFSKTFRKKLPPGNYSLLLTEEEAKGVVEWIERKVYNGKQDVLVKGYRDYERFGGSSRFWVMATALQSLHSWIRSIGKDPKLVVVLVKQ